MPETSAIVARNSSESIMSFMSVSSSAKSALLFASISSAPTLSSAASTEHTCANCTGLSPQPSALSSNEVHSFSIAVEGRLRNGTASAWNCALPHFWPIARALRSERAVGQDGYPCAALVLALGPNTACTF